MKFNEAGRYELRYKATDACGNVTEKERIVYVNPAPDGPDLEVDEPYTEYPEYGSIMPVYIPAGGAFTGQIFPSTTLGSDNRLYFHASKPMLDGQPLNWSSPVEEWPSDETDTVFLYNLDMFNVGSVGMYVEIEKANPATVTIGFNGEVSGDVTMNGFIIRVVDAG